MGELEESERESCFLMIPLSLLRSSLASAWEQLFLTDRMSLNSERKYFCRQLFSLIWEAYRTSVRKPFHDRQGSCTSQCCQQCPNFQEKCWFIVKVWWLNRCSPMSKGIFQSRQWDFSSFRWFAFITSCDFEFLD